MPSLKWNESDLTPRQLSRVPQDAIQGHAKARQPAPYRSKTEARYASLLDLQHKTGDVIAWEFESIKLRLGPNTWYTPDFLIITNDMTIELHEVKGGYIRDKGAVKFKTARHQYPWLKFRMMQEKKAGQGFTEIYTE